MKTVTVADFENFIALMKREKAITGATEIHLSSDGEGNSYSPLVILDDGRFNIEVAKKKMTLYPMG